MNIREITKNVHYVGVNDRTTDRFEGLWPLPNGVSYNSYIVSGDEKIALIDTVEIGSIRELLNSMANQLGNKSIDYLIINHMEPDHSGGITAVLTEYPEAKLVGNKQTIAMVKDFIMWQTIVFWRLRMGRSWIWVERLSNSSLRRWCIGRRQ